MKDERPVVKKRRPDRLDRAQAQRGRKYRPKSRQFPKRARNLSAKANEKNHEARQKPKHDQEFAGTDIGAAPSQLRRQRKQHAESEKHAPQQLERIECR